jgi:hypothetical protein
LASDSIWTGRELFQEDLIMAEQRGADRAGRRSKRFLSPLQKYEIWLQLVRQEVTMAEAADAHQVDRFTIMRTRTVAKEGALAESRPGVKARARDVELGRRCMGCCPRPLPDRVTVGAFGCADVVASEVPSHGQATDKRSSALLDKLPIRALTWCFVGYRRDLKPRHLGNTARSLDVQGLGGRPT